MADQPPPGVNMPKKRDPRLRQMQAPQQQQFFDSADYEVRKQQHQGHGQMLQGGGGMQRHTAMDGGNARPGCAGAPQGPSQSQIQQYQQRQFQEQQPPPSAPQSNARVPPNLQSPAF